AFYKYKHLTGIAKDQLRYVILGTLIAGTFGAFFNLVIPLFWNTHKFVWIGPLFTVFIIACSSYAITRYRLMDIRIAVRKGVIYFLAAIFSYGFFYFSVWLLTRLFGSVYDHGALFLGIFIALCFVSLFFLFEKILNATVDKHIFGILYTQHETLRELSQRLTTIIDFKKLISDIMDVVKETLAVNRIAVALKIDDDGFKLIKCEGFKKNEIDHLLKNEELKKYFPVNNKPLTIEELDVKKCGILKNDIIKSQADFLLPLISKNKLQGVIILGKKISGDAFSQEDLSLLETLSHQAALAIENAKLYDKLEEWNDKLKEKVDEQTKDIRGKNMRLKKLLEMKTEFLRTASHQLRTPVSAIKGLVSMMRDGDFDDEDEETKRNAFSGIFRKTQKMTNIMDDILAAAELDSEDNFKLNEKNLSLVDIAAVTEKVIEEVKENIKEKGIEIRIMNQESGIKNGDEEERNIEDRQISGDSWSAGKNPPLSPFGKGGKPHPDPLLKGEGNKTPLPPFEKGGNPPLVTSLKEGKYLVLSNEADLRHIMINLLDNAITYTKKGGRVEIRIESGIMNQESRIKNREPSFAEAAEGKEIKKLRNKEIGKFTVSAAVSARDCGAREGTPQSSLRDCGGEYIIWSVKDNGIGIPKESQKHMFEKFKRGKNANSMNCDGSGLGLFIVKKLVEAHHGAEVGFTSKEGEGSEFWVKFVRVIKQ
ncbi:MAG: ATP-binding protein, partial [bacterium]